MTVKDFALVVVRLFGLWVLFECIVSAERTVAAMAPMFNMPPEYTRFVVLANLFDFLLHATIGVALTWKPQIVTSRLHLPISNNAEVRLSTTNLIFLCFSVTGLIFLMTGLGSLLYHVARWLFAPKPPYEFTIDKAGIVTSIFQAAMGLWLLCRFKGIVRGLRWLLHKGRTFGIKEGY